jgi:hypothetical protein
MDRVPLLKRRSSKLTTLRQALSDDNLLGSVLSGPSWEPWRVLLIASMGEALTDDERFLFAQLTGRDHEPNQRVEEFVAVVGRRGGKSRAISVLASYVSALCEHKALVPGETGIVLVIAPDQKQADIVLNYVEANFQQSPILSQLIDGRTQRTLRLKNNISIEVRASDFRTLRGPTYVACIADELAFWLTNESSSNPDTEILNAVRPGLATTHGPLFLISSPYARRGELWSLYDAHYGPKGDAAILVAQAASRTMNPTLSQSVVDRAMERDPASASAEYMAQFRSDIESYVSLETVRACITPNILQRLPQPDIAYQAFCDPSGGAADSMTLAIGHLESNREVVVVDCLREVKAPFSPEAAVSEFAQFLKDYHLTSVVGDKYAALWPVEQFRRFGITYKPEAEAKSILYGSLLASINSKRVELLDSPRLVAQLTGLERRVNRGGRDTIDHQPGAHDDLANACAGVVATILAKPGFNWAAFNDSTPEDPDGVEAYRSLRLHAYINSFRPNYGGRWG